MASSSEEIERAVSTSNSRSGHSCWASLVSSRMCFAILVLLNFVCCILNLSYCAYHLHQYCPCDLSNISGSDNLEGAQAVCLSVTLSCIFEAGYASYFLLDFFILTCWRYPRLVSSAVVTLEWIILLLNQVWFTQPTWIFIIAIFFLIVRSILAIIGDGERIGN